MMRKVVTISFLASLIAFTLEAQAQDHAKGKDYAKCEVDQGVMFENFENPQSALIQRITKDKNYGVRNGFMTLRYVANQRGSERNSVLVPLPRPLHQASLNFDYFVPADFDFVLGGKLFGFAPQNPVWGGREGKAEGWSSRIMWRKDGRPVTYNYHQNRPGKYGEDSEPQGDPHFIPKGEWVSLSLYLDLGTGHQNGSSEVWVNGVKAGELTDLDFHAPGIEAPIETLALQSFFGGSSPKWAPKHADGSYRNLSALVDNLGVTEGRCIRPKPIN